MTKLPSCAHAIFALLMWFTAHATVDGQVILRGVVIDAETKQPIPYVNIGVKARGAGTVSDEGGAYELKVKAATDEVTFSAIGFTTRTIAAEELTGKGTVALAPREYAIPTVEITGRRLSATDQIYGVRNKTRGLSVGFGSAQLGTEIAAPIRLADSVWVKSAHFVLNHAKGDSLFFRINLYELNGETPGEKLLRENVFYSEKQQKGTFTVDLTPYNLILSGDVLLSLEWIRDDGKGNKDITFDTKKSRQPNGVYHRKSSLGEFEKMRFINDRLKPCFYLTGRPLTQ